MIIRETDLSEAYARLDELGRVIIGANVLFPHNVPEGLDVLEASDDELTALDAAGWAWQFSLADQQRAEE